MYHIIILNRSVFNKNYNIIIIKPVSKNVCINFPKMLYYDRTDASKEIDDNKPSGSKECIICSNCYFSNKRSRFQVTVCNCCRDVIY